MHHERLITGVAVALGVSAAVTTVLAVVYNPAILVLSATLGAAAFFMWYQASGRLASRVYRSVENQARVNSNRRDQREGRGGFGAGPREEWTPPGGRRRASTDGRGRTGGGRGRTARGRGRRSRRRRASPSTDTGPSREEAYRRLGLDPGADEAAVKEAYRQKVKEVHPDTEGGDEEAFKQVNRAYERLT